MKLHLCLQIILLLLLSGLLFCQIPKRISYQGVFTTSGGAPAADGSYNISFIIYDASSGGSLLFTENHTDVAVQRGTFKVILGSVTPLNLPFDRTYYLEMTVNSGPGISAAVVFPRSEFTSSPYSLRADTSLYSSSAQPVGTAGGDLSGSYPNPTIAANVITPSKINSSGASSGQTLLFNGSNVVWGTPAGSGGSSFQLPYVDSVAADTAAIMITNKGNGFGSVFLNTKSDGYLPAVFGKSLGQGDGIHGEVEGQGTAIAGVAKGSTGRAAAFSIDNVENASNALEVMTLGTGKGLFAVGFSNSDVISAEVGGSGNGTALHAVNLNSGYAGKFESFHTYSAAPTIRVENNGTALALDSYTSGTGGGGKFQIDNLSSTSNALEGLTSGSGIAVKGYQSGTGHGGWFEINNSSNNYPSLFTRTNGNGNSFFSYHNGTARAGLFTVDNPGNANPAIDVSTTGSGYAGFFAGTSKGMYISTNSTINNPQLVLMENETDYTRVNFQNKNTAHYWTIAAQPNNDSKIARLNFYYSPSGDFMTVTGDGNVGIGTGSPTSKLTVAGTAEMNVVQINGGSDLAEPFEVMDTREEIEPGTLLSIDDKNPGKLRITTTEYDTKIAGIVSGAGGINPGITLHQDGFTEGNTYVAIAGRVYCKADASFGAIQPGDLVTSSPVPGYAMKATDRDRSQGAIVGKAMSGLKDGRGLVLILVNLQ